MHAVIAYDISINRTRSQVFRILRELGINSQRSVFECELTAEEIVARVKWGGITGMGGAGFPCHVKLCPPPTAKAECVILNGVECEPYITSDYRLMLEHADEILWVSTC